MFNNKHERLKNVATYEKKKLECFNNLSLISSIVEFTEKIIDAKMNRVEI